MDIKDFTFQMDANRLTIFRNILNDDVVSAMLKFTGENSKHEILAAYGQLYFSLALASEHDEKFLTDGWKNHLLNLIFWDDNPFARQAAGRAQRLSPAVKNAALYDLQCLHRLYHWQESCALGLGVALPCWEKMISAPSTELSVKFQSFMEKFECSNLRPDDWVDCVDLLTENYFCAGVGVFGRYHSLRWDGGLKSITGVNHPDPVRLSELIGYERERAMVLDNTETFLAGYPANNVLLYGDRGTGKSSTVKALANAYADRGLRLVEIPKQYLADLPVILRQIDNRARHFILFVDDLSFEDFEVEYKVLKAVLEGGVEIRPRNVLIYATSNRRNLVRESFKERRQDDVHAGDTMQEKLSLADRFGLTVTFIAPDQKRYLEIVEGLARQRGLKIGTPELHAQAIQWELRHSGRSGRTARQLIDYLEGKLARS